MKNMSVYRSRPGSLWDFMNEFERAFDTALTDRSPQMTAFNPAVDIDESDDHYLVSMDLPGVKEQDIKVDVHLGQLTISGTRSYESKKERKDDRFYERSFGEFKRSFTLPQEVDGDDIQARFENGVLEVFIPKAAKAQARSIKVESGKGGLFSRLLGENKEKTSSSEH
jgi:HSP20 family protein